MIDGRLTLVTAPAAEPISLETARNHLRVSSSVDDERIVRLLKVARGDVETETHRALCTQTWDWKFDRWDYCGDGFELPLPPLQSVTWIKYRDADDVEQTWPTTEYDVSIPVGPHAERGRVHLSYSGTFPILRSLRVDAVTVRFVAGYGAAAAVPAEIVQAVLMRLSWLYDKDEDANKAATTLLAPFVSKRF